jgi:hypothetical protein
MSVATPVEEAHVGRWLEHVRALAGDIGPRGPATAAEHRAMNYCERTLIRLGLAVGEDRFLSAGSVFRPHLVAAYAILAAFLIYPLAPWPAAALVALAVCSEILELTLHPNPLQWAVPKRPSRNVFATVDPVGRLEQDLVLIGHVDSQRTPKIFSSPGWFAAYRAFSTASFASFTLMAAGYVLGAVYGWPWVWPVSAIGAAAALVLAAICVEAERSPFTAGANDNATGAGLVLTLGEDLLARPLLRTRVWLLCSGCEEALHEGARAFFGRHRADLTQPRAVIFEMLGCSGPAWLVKEAIVLPVRSDPGLRALAEMVAADDPELGAYPAALDGGVTEMADALAAGIPAITVIGLTDKGKAPYWHVPADTVDKMIPGVMERNYRFVRALIGAVDGA